MRPAFGLVVMLLACSSGGPGGGSGGGSSGTGGGSSGTGGGSSGIGGGSSGPREKGCSQTQPCTGQAQCFDGLCLEPCDAGCAAAQSCGFDGLCHPDPVTACPVTPCGPTQICAEGLCSTPPPATVCGTNPFGPDLCAPNAVCLDSVVVDGVTVDPFKCSFPACQSDGGCPVGPFGALCNVGYFTDISLLCLPKMCSSARECPPDWLCIRSAPTKPYGHCTSRRAGDLCSQPSDCLSSMCHQLGLGTIGTCL